MPGQSNNSTMKTRSLISGNAKGRAVFYSLSLALPQFGRLIWGSLPRTEIEIEIGEIT